MKRKRKDDLGVKKGKRIYNEENSWTYCGTTAVPMRRRYELQHFPLPDLYNIDLPFHKHKVVPSFDKGDKIALCMTTIKSIITCITLLAIVVYR